MARVAGTSTVGSFMHDPLAAVTSRRRHASSCACISEFDRVAIIALGGPARESLTSAVHTIDTDDTDALNVPFHCVLVSLTLAPVGSLSRTVSFISQENTMS